MKRDFFTVYGLGILAAAVVAGQQAQTTRFTARELFYSAAEAPAAASPKPAAAQSAATNKPVEATSTSKPVAAASAGGAGPDASASAATLPDGTRAIKTVILTAPAPSEGRPLGLRYTILKLIGADMGEVAPGTVFHAGDSIQFSIQTNGPGYLYIVSQGSSGMWKPMFPSVEVEDGSNRVEGFRAYLMPPKSRLVFDQEAGSEKIFMVFSRQPEPSLESTIYSLQAPKTQPPSPPAPQFKQLLMVSVEDDMVGRLRNSYARELITQRVDETTPGVQKEKAVYIVNPTGSEDSRVVADLRLVHQ